MVTPRYREIDWSDGYRCCTTLEVCKNRIIVGGDDGQIEIYNSSDLHRQTVLIYGNTEAAVTCLQCTCTEIIAGYVDGSVCVWDIQRGILVQTLVTADATGDRTSSVCMRWKHSKLVVGADVGTIRIWENVDYSFTLQCNWNARDGRNPLRIQDGDFNEDYIILKPTTGSGAPSLYIHIYSFNGELFCPIYINEITTNGSTREQSYHMLQGRHVENLGHF